ncbi:MAG TPA: DUF4350 domain-containing protein [Terriglobia bacterium]|nr:DUF4350 domain-containing protein [Terriglobia bacterium]
MKRTIPALILLIAAVGFVLVIIQLLQNRFEAGDVYPPYSSLRSDPLGTMVLFESLQDYPELTLRRDYSTAERLPEPAGTLYLHLAAELEPFRHLSASQFDEVDHFVRNGGRLLIALRPVPAEVVRAGLPKSEAQKKREKEEKEEAKKEEERALIKSVSLLERWKFNTKIVNFAEDRDNGYVPEVVTNVSRLPLPKTLLWHSGIVLTDLAPDWKPIYTREQQPVVVERQFDKGSVVIATDSYFLSNEAMVEDRHSDLLAWVVGSQEIIYFDEAHFGITESVNMAGLIRRYRLHWAIACFVLLAILFVWKNSSSLAPIPEEERQPAFVFGKESGEGFVNLLRRNVSPRDLLKTCIQQWKQSATTNYLSIRKKEAEAAMAQASAAEVKENITVEQYRHISRILQKRTS